MSLRIALFGQAPLALQCLDDLIAAEHDVVAVFAPPDASRPDPLAARARELGLRVLQRRFFQRRDGQPLERALDEYAELAVDLNVLASMTSFLPSAITDAPKHKSICFHPSLLPRYRGGNALQWQIIEGERETGVSIFIPDAGVDTGPIVVQKAGVTIEETDTTATLFFQKLAPLGAEALREAVERIDRGDLRASLQDEADASFQGLVSERDARVDWSLSATEVARRIRGCDPQPGAWTQLGADRLHLYAASVAEAPAAQPAAQPGTVLEISEQGILICAGDRPVRVGRVRGDAAKEPAQAFALRSGLQSGACFA